ncbi:rho-related GTP-binding protein RhoF-like isoform X2 [Acanthopagrus latus]|uniref:rho-related GTP-binding protein RhoF-like isoform X2 n=1 Tax=Acanthopagrus latus TaxID=8177 RepID=UPI00187CD046|nr:rho-related GTP-binding protein RhoF-like isoform X2 [Acanthopagrus latus]
MSRRGSEANRGSTSHREEFKVVIVGDRGCGKTALLKVYTTGDFPEEYVPSVFDTSVVNSRYRGQYFRLHLYDTAGREDYDRLRPLSYNSVDVALICYDIMCPESFDNVFVKCVLDFQKEMLTCTSNRRSGPGPADSLGPWPCTLGTLRSTISVTECPSSSLGAKQTYEKTKS